jgi:hypothetical protein
MKNLRVRHFDGFAVLVVLFLFVTGLLSHAQAVGTSVQPVMGPSYSVPDHPSHANYADLRPEVSLIGGNSYTYAQGERPMSDFPSDKRETPLGDVARQYREDHKNADKATIHWNQQ